MSKLLSIYLEDTILCPPTLSLVYLPPNRTLFTLHTVLLKLPELGEVFPRNGWTDVKSIQRDVTDGHLFLENKNQKIGNTFQEMHWARGCTQLLYSCNWNIGYGKVLIWKAAQKNSVRTEPEDVSNWTLILSDCPVGGFSNGSHREHFPLLRYSLSLLGGRCGTMPSIYSHLRTTYSQ